MAEARSVRSRAHIRDIGLIPGAALFIAICSLHAPAVFPITPDSIPAWAP